MPVLGLEAGVVVVGHCIASGEAVAVKMVCKDRLRTPVEIRDMKHEVDICSRVCAGSLNCISLYETFEDSRMVYMVRTSSSSMCGLVAAVVVVVDFV